MESFRDVNYLADMAGAHHIVLTCRVESGWTVDSDVGAVFGDDREAEIVVHVLMRGDKGSYLTVGEHFVDAFALEALIHPHEFQPQSNKYFVFLPSRASISTRQE